MGNSFCCALSPVELGDMAAREDDVPDAVAGGGQETDRVSGECLGQFERLALEADPSAMLDAADLMLGGVLDGRQGFRDPTRRSHL